MSDSEAQEASYLYIPSLLPLQTSLTVKDWPPISRTIDPPYPVYGGLFREEAIMLLRRFYIQENDKGEQEKPYLLISHRLTSAAPKPRPKKNRQLNTKVEYE